MARRGDLDLAELLQFQPERGQILLRDYRMVMMSAASLGCLRRELIETLGPDEARGLLKRFGHAAGLADARALAERFPQASRERQMNLGPALHALEGIARIVRDQRRSRVDLAAGRYHVEAYWENSFEAEQHLALIGPSAVPVCWTLAGYATGHSSVAAGRSTVVVETECAAMGAPRCRFVVGLADEMPDDARREAADYEPHRLPERLAELLDTIRSQKRTLKSLRSELDARGGGTELIGSSPALVRVLDMARQVAPVGTTVLILGESGTGKELLARSIHEQSQVAKGPFVAVNCSALPENLQEAELFGFRKGAFTGAVDDSRGLFEAADGGTLFLDEIGDLALPAQTKILRALQEGEIRRLGETEVRRVTVRVVAATNRDLEAMVRERTFRDDLYYRLSVVPVVLPPLRDRGDDALVLARHFVARYARRFGKKIRGLSRSAKCAVAAYRWPGNVRELQNAIERGVILAQGDVVELEDLPEQVVAGATAAPPPPARARGAGDATPLAAIGDEAERIRAALETTGGNRRRAAAMLGLSRTTLWRRMRALDLGGD